MKGFPVPDPVAFSVLGIDIMWYAIMITAGMITGVLISCKRAPMRGLSSDQLLNIVIITVPVAVIGARLYYVVFNWASYAGDFMKIINIRGGGLAIHGGLIFGALTIVILCCIWKIRPLDLFDLIVPGVAIAQAIGRWGNYFNSEAHGGPADLPWSVNINGVLCHPTFLYESIWCLVLCFVLIWADNRRIFEGQILLMYCMMYSAERFFVEWLRTDSLMIGPFKQAQVLSLTVIIICGIMYIVMRNNAVKRNRQ